MQHLSNCVEIRDRYWAEIYNLMKETDINYIKTDAFLILGAMGPKIVIDKEGAAILAFAWRCLYAETVGARAEDRENLT